tara:strand:- start:99 stop:374 length:276 start_codon:yes stop_codon:yes gene_type:complete
VLKTLIHKYQLTAIFCTTIVADFWSSWYGYAITHDWIVLQAFLGMVMPFLYFTQTYFFIEAESLKEKLKITAVCALSMTIGSTVMLLMVNS